MKILIKMLVIPGLVICTNAIAQPDTVIQNNQNATRTTPALQKNPQDNQVHTIQNPAPIRHMQTDSVRTQQNTPLPPTKQTNPVHHNGARVDSVPSINRNTSTIYTDSTRVIHNTTPTKKDTIK